MGRERILELLFLRLPLEIPIGNDNLPHHGFQSYSLIRRVALKSYPPGNLKTNLGN